jgi:hypothetical protein
MKFDTEDQRGRRLARTPMRALVVVAAGLAMSAAWSAQIAGTGIGKVVNSPASTRQTTTTTVSSTPAKPAPAGRSASSPKTK